MIRWTIRERANSRHALMTIRSLISKHEDDGKVLITAKVVDNIIFVATNQELEGELIKAMRECGYTVKVEASNKYIGMQIEYLAKEKYTYTKGDTSRS